MRNFGLLFLMLCAGLTGKAQIKNIYVSPVGNDNNTGTLQRPFKTLPKAILFSNEFKNEKVTVQLRGGTYYLDNTLMLNAGDILPSALKVTAYKNEPVTISAGRRLALRWTVYKKGIYQATVPKGLHFERLYINGKAQILARYPNYNDTSRVYHGTAADAISPERVSTWKNPVDGYVHALHEGEWGSFDYLITGLNTDGTLKLEGGWQNNRPSPMNKQYRFVENIFEELDAPGEWYLDRIKEILYYYPPKNIKLTTALVEVSHLKNTIELQGSVSKPVKNVTISGINFRHNERSFMDTREPLVRSDWSIYRGGAVLFAGTENCKISNCTFEGLGGNAIMVSNYNKNDTISGCLIDHIGASAVCFIGDPEAVRSALFKYEDSLPYDKIDKTPGPKSQNYPQQCVVTDNLFHDLGEIEKQATGVQITMSSEITVSHNSIYNTPRAGLNINDGCWGGHVLAYNDVFNTVLETGDHGAFNSWGRDRYWSADRAYMDSIVKVHPELILLDAQKPNILHDNRFRCDHGWDIDLDDGSTNYHIYNNVCLNGGIKLREGFYRIVENNILINNTLHPHVWFLKSGDAFKHNIVMKKYAPVQIRDWGTRIDDNFFTDTMALNTSRKKGTDTHSIAGDPMFINAKAGNYALQPNSPVYKIGYKAIPMDEFGVQKPELKRLALTPAIPLLITNKQKNGELAIIPFLGGTIRNIQDLDERSALGLPNLNGVLIVFTDYNSLLTQSGLHNNDVIVDVDNRKITGITELLAIVKDQQGKSIIPITIYRNQQPYQLWLKIR